MVLGELPEISPKTTSDGASHEAIFYPFNHRFPRGPQRLCLDYLGQRPKSSGIDQPADAIQLHDQQQARQLERHRARPGGSEALEDGLDGQLYGPRVGLHRLAGGGVFGGIIGAPIDFATGAAWEYPNTVTVPLKPTYQPAAAYPSPAAVDGSAAIAPMPVTAAPQLAPAAGAPATGTVYYAPAPTSATAPQYQYMPPAQFGAQPQPQQPAAR